MSTRIHIDGGLMNVEQEPEPDPSECQCDECKEERAPARTVEEVTIILRERARAGATFLDTEEPDWAGYVDVDRLEMSSSYACILGQAFGDYGEGLSAFDLSNREAERYGFVHDPMLRTNEFLFDPYSVLTDEWKKLVTERKQS